MSDPEQGATQTILATPDLVAQGVYGNCMQAAIATVLHKPLDAVPHFGAFTWWPGAMRLWLRGEGFDYTHVDAPPIPEQRAMLVGKSPRGYSHAVVSEGGRIAWDPHPSRDGLTDISGAYVIHEWDGTDDDGEAAFLAIGGRLAAHDEAIRADQAERIAVAIEGCYLGADFGRNYDGTESPETALGHAHDEALQHAAEVARTTDTKAGGE